MPLKGKTKFRHLQKVKLNCCAIMKRLSGKYTTTSQKTGDETAELEMLVIVVAAASGKPDSAAPFPFFRISVSYFFLSCFRLSSNSSSCNSNFCSCTNCLLWLSTCIAERDCMNVMSDDTDEEEPTLAGFVTPLAFFLCLGSRSSLFSGSLDKMPATSVGTHARTRCYWSRR